MWYMQSTRCWTEWMLNAYWFLYYRFRLTYRLILREKELHFNLAVYNPSIDTMCPFHLLLHTYFKVPDVRRCQITGLFGCMFIDKVIYLTNNYEISDYSRIISKLYIMQTRDNNMYQETRDVVTVNEWTDRIYQCTPQEIMITNVVSGRKMKIQKYNLSDTGIILKLLFRFASCIWYAFWQDEQLLY